MSKRLAQFAEGENAELCAAVGSEKQAVVGFCAEY